jgi:hypothetical protein
MKAALVFSLAVTLTLLIALTAGCSGSLTTTVHASTPDCTPELFFDMPQNQQNQPGGGAIEGPHYLWMVTPACVITTAVNSSYVTHFDHDVQLMTIQMGSNQDSVFEWDQVITAITSAGEVLISQQQQYDKHIDDHGNKQERYSYTSPIHIPAGSTIRVTRRVESNENCIKGGKFGDRVACYTGGGVQFQDVVK